MTALNRGNGVNTAYSYHGVGEQFRLLRHNSTALDINYNSYDNVGNLKQTAARYGNEAAEGLVNYAYDDLNRLTSVTGHYARSYSYMSIGNINSITDGSGTRTFAYGSGRPHAVTAVTGGGVNKTYEYDPNGNLDYFVDNGTPVALSSYDNENRLGTHFGGGGQSDFLYDHSGQRMKTTFTVGGVIQKTTYYPFSTYELIVDNAVPTAVTQLETTTQTRKALSVLVLVTLAVLVALTQRSRKWQRLVVCFLLFGLSLVAAPTNVTTAQIGTTQRLNYLFGGQAIAVRNSGGLNSLTYLHGDHLGSVNVLTDDNGAVVSGSVSKYDPFGAYRTQRSDTENPTEMGFTGHHHDDGIGLIYMNARFFVPEIGRFAAPDSIVPDATNPQSLNRYSYVENNPMGFTDPSGNCRRITIYGLFGSFSLPCIGAPTAPLLPSNQLTTDVQQWAANLAPRAQSAWSRFTGQLQRKTQVTTDIVQEFFAAVGRNVHPAPDPEEYQIDIAPIPDVNQDDDREREILYHYTTIVGMESIVETLTIYPSTGLRNARYGNGQYFTDISPKETTLATAPELSYALYGGGLQWRKVMGYVAIDVTGLEISQVSSVYGRRFPNRFFYLYSSDEDLDLTGRLVGYGETPLLDKRYRDSIR